MGHVSRTTASRAPLLRSARSSVSVETLLLKDGEARPPVNRSSDLRTADDIRVAVDQHLSCARETSSAMCLVPTARVPNAFLAKEFELQVVGVSGRRRTVLWSSRDHLADPAQATESLIRALSPTKRPRHVAESSPAI